MWPTPGEGTPIVMVNTEMTLSRINVAISRLQIDQAEREVLQRKAARYSNECGCSTGSLFLIAATIGLIVDAVFFAGNFGPSIWNIGWLLGAAMVGKLTGMIAGRIRLFLLCRRLTEPGALQTEALR